MPCQFSIGESVVTTRELDADNGTVAAGETGMVMLRHAAVGSCLYVVRFARQGGPDATAPAFENDLRESTLTFGVAAGRARGMTPRRKTTRKK